MMIEKVEKSSGNVFADLGFTNPEQMMRKSELVMMIDQTIKSKGMTSIQAAKVLGIDADLLSQIRKGVFHTISEYALLDYVARLGHRVKIIVSNEIEPVMTTPDLVFA